MLFDEMISEDARVMKSSLIRQLTGLVNQPDVISFATGSPNAEMFPHEQLAEIFNDLVGAEKGKLFQYGVTRGNADLIEAVRERNARIHGMEASTEETILVSGSQQGLDFVARVLLDPGDAVFVELPNYIGATASFENFRARMIGVNKTAAGMDLDDLRTKIRRARSEGSTPKLIYVIPNFQNPSGHTWDLATREALIEVAREENVLILEDDAYGEVYFSGDDPEILKPIKSHEGADNVIYMSTFSKVLAPGLRVAWIVGPKQIVRRIELAKETGDLCTSTLSQKLILEYLRRDWLDSHLAEVRGFYETKCILMQAALEKYMSSVAKWNRPQGGLFLWVELLQQIDTLPLLHQAVEQERVAFIPGQPFFVDGSGSNTLRLSFSNVSDDNIDLGLEKISRLIAQAAR
ncbi:MAG TPA: PLP-dependent aminotransferase family protein [Bryobacterales bacterium]|nr:PLP-dependent aminotransferase family protein [Bryobacterales bacterium]